MRTEDVVDPGSGPKAPRQQVNQPRVAEMIATTFRRRILEGDLVDGDFLPKSDELTTMFGVSKPSIREAMRILETEGLISVRRGNVGGAKVHAPNASTAGYTIGLVLQAGQVTMADLGSALLDLESACAARAASRLDRSRTVVPHLLVLHNQLEQARKDPAGFTRIARQFHEAIVTGGGNATMALLAGALESLWSKHEAIWLEFRDAEVDDDEVAQRVLDAHMDIVEAIERGDALRARDLVLHHLAQSQTYMLSSDADKRIDVTSSFSDLFGPARQPD